MSTGIKKEWWHNNAEMTERELVGVLRRMKRRGEIITDEPIGPRQPITMTVMGGAPAGATPKPAKRTPPQQTFTCRGCQTVVPIRKGGTARVWCSDACRISNLRASKKQKSA